MSEEAPPDNRFFDTNVLVYAYTEPNSMKGRKAQRLLSDVFEGRVHAAVSNQILAELSNTLISKFGAHPDSVNVIMESIAINTNWLKLNYTVKTVMKCISALDSKGLQGNYFFDMLIAQTMKENGITTLVTENTKDFEGIEGITLVNPFK